VSIPLILTSFPAPKAEIQPQTVTEPSSCLIAGCKQCMSKHFPVFRCTHWHLLDSNSSNFNSSGRSPQFHCSVAQSWYCLANFSLFTIFLWSQHWFLHCNSAMETCCNQPPVHSAGRNVNVHACSHLICLLLTRFSGITKAEQPQVLVLPWGGSSGSSWLFLFFVLSQFRKTITVERQEQNVNRITAAPGNAGYPC